MKNANTNSYLILAALFSIFTLNSCTSSINRSSESYTKIEYPVENFNKINLIGGYNVKIKQGEDSKIAMNTSDDNHHKIKIHVDNEVLKVSNKVKNIGTDEVNLTITVKNLEDINIEGGVFLTTNGFISVDNLNIRVKGGAHIDMQINANKIRARAEGGVNMEFEGVTDEFYASTEGAGNIDADNLKSRIVTCKVTGVGNASVYATEHLDATVEGLGKIGYRGDPSINKQTHGIGLVYRK